MTATLKPATVDHREEASKPQIPTADRMKAQTAMPPDPEEMNEARASAAGRALLSFARDFGETDEECELGIFAAQNLGDLLADFAHFCDRTGLSLLSCIETARAHYAEETDELGEQFGKIG